MKGPYLRAALKAEIRRARARGETKITGVWLESELGASCTEIDAEFERAKAELDEGSDGGARD